MPDIVDWQQPPRRFLPRRLFFLVLAILAIVIFSSRTALSYYVDALWFGSLGYGDVFRKTLTLQWAVFAAFFAVTFLFLYGWFLALRRSYQSDLPDDYRIVIGGQPLKLPVARILHVLGLVVSLVIAVVTGASMMTEWPTFALYWYATRATGGAVDPIFGKPINFYLFTLPAWQFVTGWLLTLSVIACVIAVFFIFVTGSTTILSGLRSRYTSRPWRGFSIAFGLLLLILAMRAYIARFERLFDEHTIFGGVTYTDAHVKDRSEEHTPELQSRQYLVCRLLLEKKKKLAEPISSVDLTTRRHSGNQRTFHHTYARHLRSTILTVGYHRLPVILIHVLTPCLRTNV